MKLKQIKQIIKEEIQNLQEQIIYGCAVPGALNYYPATTNGCDGNGSTECCIFVNMTFMNNMVNGVNSNGCSFLANRYNVLEGKLTMLQNRPDKQKSPAWQAKLISKLGMINMLQAKPKYGCTVSSGAHMGVVITGGGSWQGWPTQQQQ